MKFRVIIDAANHEVQLFPEMPIEHAMMKLLGDGTWKSHVTIEGGYLHGEVRRVSLVRVVEQSEKARRYLSGRLPELTKESTVLAVEP